MKFTQMDKSCIFCKIINGDEKSINVFENDKLLAFLDKRPLFQGHCLLVPKIHIQSLNELPATLINPLFLQTQKLAMAVQTAMNAQGNFIAMNNYVSQSVPHLHIHIVPRNKQDGLKGFFWPRQLYASEADMLLTQEKIKKFLN